MIKRKAFTFFYWDNIPTQIILLIGDSFFFFPLLAGIFFLRVCFLHYSSYLIKNILQLLSKKCCDIVVAAISCLWILLWFFLACSIVGRKNLSFCLFIAFNLKLFLKQLLSVYFLWNPIIYLWKLSRLMFLFINFSAENLIHYMNFQNQSVYVSWHAFRDGLPQNEKNERPKVFFCFFFLAYKRLPSHTKIWQK